tara:strand:- start:93 stop:524 length:432 start_codon:yes stop_codon:yes gene_type:complete
MECQICYNKTTPQKDAMVLLHDSNHKVCQECYAKLRQNKITRCPFCRERINKDIVDTSSDTDTPLSGVQHLHQTPQSYIHHIDIQRLKEYGISHQFIETIRNTLPFSYTNRFEGVAFIVETKQKYEEWITPRNETTVNAQSTL